MNINDECYKDIYYAVVVLYNMKVDDSVTIKNLKRIKEYKINTIVVDNSTKEFNNKEICIENNYTYLSMNGNGGLSKAYNAVLDFLKDKNGIIIWFDDDTRVTQEYFDVLDRESKSKQEIDIFAPIIQGQDGKFWSPNEYRYIKNKQLKNKNQKINPKKFNAINSCTAVRLSVYRNYRYTEQLFLDQVDHQFFEDQRVLKRKFEKLDVIIHHDFSIKSKIDDIEKVKLRYSIMIPDFLVFCNKSIFRYILGWIKVIGWGIRESIKYKNVSFLIWCIRTAYIASKKIRG